MSSSWSAAVAGERCVPLWPGKPPHSVDDFEPYLELHTLPSLRAGEKRGAVIVCPGGGYGGRASHEGRPVAEAVVAAGLHAFVLHYRVSPNRHPAPLLDASRAVRLVRARAEEWAVLVDKVAIMGFSAGGHLAGSLSVLHEKFGSPTEEDDLSRSHSNRPDASLLCYAVISSSPGNKHQGSFKNLLGEEAGESASGCEPFSLELQVNAATPPAFLWHTTGDTAVPASNSLLYAHALASVDVPYELHIYPGRKHGIGLASSDSHAATWMPLAIGWLKELKWNGAAKL